jgi:hypothetical protein
MRSSSVRRRLLASLIDLIVGLFVAIACVAGGIALLVLRGRFQRAGEGPDRDAIEPPCGWRLSFRHKAILWLATVGFGVLDLTQLEPLAVAAGRALASSAGVVGPARPNRP